MFSVKKINGHDVASLKENLNAKPMSENKPSVFIANTIKGKGVSFMEHPRVMKKQQIYTWHAGAPNDKAFLKAQNELIEKIKIKFKKIVTKNDTHKILLNSFSLNFSHFKQVLDSQS